MGSGLNGWTKYLVGVLVSLILFIAIPTMAGHIIDNDKSSRERDEKLNDKIETSTMTGMKDRQDIKIMLTEIKTDLVYIKQKVR